MSYKYEQCKRCRAISRLYPDLNPDEVFNETYIRVMSVKNIRDHVAVFYRTSKSAAAFLRNPNTIQKDFAAYELWDTETTPYQTALNNYLEHNDDTYSRIVEMYLLEPNLSKIARDTKIKYYQLREILDNALIRIGFEYLTLHQ